MTVHLILPAAGIGKRFGAAVPKQYIELAGRPVMSWTLARCARFPMSGKTVIALAADDVHASTILAQYPNVHRVVGGAERVDSVLSALEWLVADGVAPADWVMVHDIARPNIDPADVDRLLQACFQTGHGALLAKPLTDTIKQYQSENQLRTLDRSTLWAALTPQCFPLFSLLDALKKAKNDCLLVTDEASAMEAYGYDVGIVEGAASNIKLTSTADAALLEFYLTLLSE